jgi:uncharacterized protein
VPALAPAVGAELAVPSPSGRTLDTAEVLSPATESALEALLAELENVTGAQVVVLTIPSLASEPIESFSLRVAETWRLGSGERDDGVLLVVAVEDRRVRIEVGYGLEGALPDIAASRIIRESMVPHFRRQDYETGLLAGARAIVERLMPDGAEATSVGPAGELTAPVRAVPAEVAPPAVNWELFRVWIVFLLVMPLIGLIFALFAKDAEARGITFGALLLPLMLGGSLAVDELAFFPPDSGKFLLGGVAVLALCSTLFWWLHFRLRRRAVTRARWQAWLDEAADGRIVFKAAAKLGLPVSSGSEGGARWLRRVLVALAYLSLGWWIFVSWHPAYAIFYAHNLLWLIVIYRATLHPSPSSDSSRSWSARSARSVSSSVRSWSGGSSSGGSSGFRPGGGSFGGGGASGSW